MHKGIINEAGHTFTGHTEYLAQNGMQNMRGRMIQLGCFAFGTIDSFLLWRLTGGRVHATDATNASPAYSTYLRCRGPNVLKRRTRR